MTHIYNCRHAGDQYRITKFDMDLNPQASYLTTLRECDCPAGSRPTCRHRQMLPHFIKAKAIDTNTFYNHDHMVWIEIPQDVADEPEVEAPEEVFPESEPSPETPEALEEFANSFTPTAEPNTDHVDWDTLAEERLDQRPKQSPEPAPDRSALRRI